VRRLIDSGLLTGLPVFRGLNQAHPVLLDQTLRLLLLLPGLAMELGVYGAILVYLIAARRRGQLPPDEARDTALFFSLCGLIVVSFLSSSVISNNDFGYRAVMLPQFFFTLLAADVLGAWRLKKNDGPLGATPARRRVVYSLLALGIAGSVCGAVLLRAWLPLESRHAEFGFSQLPTDGYRMRTAFEMLDRIAPQNAVVSFAAIDPASDQQADEVMSPSKFFQRMLVMNTGRQMLNAEMECGSQFGGDPAACPAIQQATAQLYAVPAPSGEWAQQYCNRFGAQYLLLDHWDKLAGSSAGWPVELPVTAQQPGFKIFQCAGK